jgi:P4 family phage/plasmid primase-like protien
MLQQKFIKMTSRERFTFLKEKVGWITVPCRMTWDSNKKSKQVHNIPKNWTSLSTLKDIEPYFKYSNNANILRTGKEVGIIGVDVDNLENFTLLWRYLYPEREIPEDNNFFNTFTVQTQKKGLHFIFKYNQRLSKNSQNLKWIIDGVEEPLGIDIRSTGGGLFFPPSRGLNEYKILPFSSLDHIREIPVSFLRFLDQSQNIINIITNERGIESVDFTQKKENVSKMFPCFQKRADLTNFVTKFFSHIDFYFLPLFWKHGNKIRKIEEAVITKNEYNGIYSYQLCFMKPGHLDCGCLSDNTYLKINTHTECVTIKCQASECNAEKILVPSLGKLLDGTEVGFANLCEIYLKGEVVFDKTTNSYHVWNSNTALWVVDPRGNTVKTHLNRTLSENIDRYNIKILNSLPDNKERDILLANVKRMRRQVRTNNCLNQIVDYLKGSRLVGNLELDKTPHLIPTKYGKVVDCKTGNIRNRIKEDYFSFELDFEYMPGQFGPFKEWLHSLFDLNNDSRQCEEFFQMLLGYFITGSTVEQIFGIWLGNKGRNGKGVILNLLESVMGSFIYKMNKGLVIENEKCSNKGASLSKLVFSRLSYIDETRKCDRFRDDFLKDISGEGVITFRPLYQSERTVHVNCKLLTVSNFAPNFDSTDNAFVRRILIIPFMKYFRQTFESDYIINDKYCIAIGDNNFKYELMKHKDKFFNYVVAGAIKYYKNIGKLMKCLPKTFVQAKNDYIFQNDPVRQFIEEFCEVGENYKVPVSGFQTKLKKEYGLAKDYSSQIISRMMLDKGFNKKQHRTIYNDIGYNTKCYMGIRINPTEEEEEF